MLEIFKKNVGNITLEKKNKRGKNILFVLIENNFFINKEERELFLLLVDSKKMLNSTDKEKNNVLIAFLKREHELIASGRKNFELGIEEKRYEFEIFLNILFEKDINLNKKDINGKNCFDYFARLIPLKQLQFFHPPNQLPHKVLVKLLR